MFVFLFIFTVFASFQEKFPQNYLDKNIVLSKLGFEEDIFISYDLSKLSPFWCDGMEAPEGLAQIFLTCYSGTVNLKKFMSKFFTPTINLDLKDTTKNTLYISSSDIEVFKFYYFLKRKFLNSKLCLLKEKNKFKITYSSKELVSLKALTTLITEYESLEKIELENNYMFFASSFRSSCEKDIFYYQTSIYNFYDVDKLFDKKIWTEKNKRIMQL